MIFINFVYKGSVVKSIGINQRYDQLGCHRAREIINNKEVNFPENYERYYLSETNDINDYVG